MSFSSRRSPRFQQKGEETSADIHVVTPAISNAVENKVVSGDLNAYELERLENIRRNEEFLASLGIANLRSEVQTQQQQRRTSQKRGVTGLKRKAETVQPRVPTRRSGRVTIDRVKAELEEAVHAGDAALIEQKQQELKQLEEKRAEASYSAVIEAQNDAAYTKRERHPAEPISMLRPLNQPDSEEDDEEKKEIQERTYGSGWGNMLMKQLRSLPPRIHSVAASPEIAGSRKKKSIRAATSTDEADWQFVEADGDSYVKQLQGLRIDEERGNTKVVKSRIYSSAFHPSSHKLLAYAGDKEGYIGIWDVDAGDSDPSSEQDGVYLYQPHVSPVSSLYTSVHQQHKLWSCSYDGTVRCMDINHEAFTLTMQAPGELESDENVLMEMAFSGMNTANVGSAGMGGAAGDDLLFVCNCSGDVVAADGRNGELIWTAEAAPGRINSIQVHPTDSNLLVLGVGGRASCILIYDIRKAPTGNKGSAKKWQHLVQHDLHSKSINSAKVSPDGQFLISVGYDDTIKVCEEFTNPSKRVSPFTLRHNNNTGRWLSTFRPYFDLKHPHAFVLGSMIQPRRMEMFAVDGAAAGASGCSIKMVATLQGDALGSVCSRNAVHPTMQAVVGGNSSGRMHLFR